MMIRINLLPVRAVKKREMGQQILALYAAVLIAAVAGNYFWYADRDGELQRANQGITQTRAKIAELEKVIGEVTNINARKAEVEKKLAVLDTLRKGRNGPVRMLDALSSSIPKKVWLKNFSEVSNKVTIDGSAVSHDEVAELMRGLGSMVWTPKGMGRLVDQGRTASKTSRVELFNTETAVVEEFSANEIKPFFGNVELSNAVQTKPTVANAPTVVDFKLTLTANYAI
ncbi:pilus assembly protein PilN [Corallococcus sp. AB004]|uniref:PilN domain-containing protein n=1 Tax=Corallococcus TaxID=83461 RepID=UPI000EA317F4|nr:MULTISPECIES: PilN domain-containing protein [Corallococcus]RKI38902.1 pilus assembly protein PilN [Corallococcus sp. AB004]NNB98287.1 pilus assembly protein PilN [Corallococcus exiguus]NPC74494.1 pilus assembly protein PilN [Corallococcus exiguus]NPD26758.1 pilus assembly protein PilN [Corallococcus exiguus]NRD49429.1 PilN domain-containing protein [Corallococcus exiguus]